MSPVITQLQKQIITLQNLLISLQKAPALLDKLAILDTFPPVQDYLQQSSPIQTILLRVAPEAQYAIKSILALGQGPIVFNQETTSQDYFHYLDALVEQLWEIETFYQHLGGIIGYHLTVITLLVNQQKETKSTFHSPPYLSLEGLHLEQDHPDVRQAVRWGIENISQLALIYPLGGSADRLNLTDEATGNPLPAACLPFLGRTLLEGMIRDLQALEYLNFKLSGQKILTPIAIMTSVEKNNHHHILQICEACQWFGRLKENFYFFIQPVVPVMTFEGNWSLSAPLTLTCKPCGHGVLWKLADEQGVFTWLESQGRHEVLIRQINNPVAGTDNTLLALMGIGNHHQKAFGFVSCKRPMYSDEGILVLIEIPKSQGYEYHLTNIEYTDFDQQGIQEVPEKPGSSFSIYPTNTNILFAAISSIRQALKICPIPGKLVNMKSKVPYLDSYGHLTHILGGRLESTMQNIADFIVDYFPQKLNQQECAQMLKTFVIYNTRSKTIAPTKKSYLPGESLHSTPEQAYYDLLSNHYVLLQQCHYQLPEWKEIKEHLLEGPACILLFHPALGPLYAIIAQKIRKGRLGQGAELQLEIAEVDIEDLILEGSLLIEAQPPLGSLDASGYLHHEQESRCTLKQVTIRNQGIDYQQVQCYWKNEVKRKEAVHIILHEGAEFHAEKIVLEGSHYFEVPPYHRLVLTSQGKDPWTPQLLPIDQPTWHWHYVFDAQNRLKITRISKKS